MNKYEIHLSWSESDQAFVADVPELPSCLAHGATYELALQNVQDAMRLWLETAMMFDRANSCSQRAAACVCLTKGRHGLKPEAQ